MSTSTTVQIRSKGSLTLPIELRRKYGFEEGDVITIIDLGDGAILLTPNISQVERYGNRVAKAIAEKDMSLDYILDTLDEERERYYQERYLDD